MCHRLTLQLSPVNVPLTPFITIPLFKCMMFQRNILKFNNYFHRG